MTLVLNEEQRILKDSARDFLTANAPVEALRTLRDNQDELGYDAELWQQMVELGWTAVAIPEEFGGLAFGFKGLGTIFQEMGHTLAASPLFSSVVLGASLIELLGTKAQCETYLPQIVSGEMTVAMAFEENKHHAPYSIATTAEKNGEGFLVSGKKTFVLDGHSASKLLLVARSDGNTQDKEGLSVFILDPATPGIEITRTMMFDSRNCANINFNNVQIPASSLIGEQHNAHNAIDKTLDRGRAILAAEMLGSSLEMLQRTIEYLKEREQFDVKIGTFQALKHRSSKMFVEIELCKSVVLSALSALDDDAENAAQLVSLAKARLNDTYQLVTNEATQMHGGIGVTDELDVGLFLKRARVSAHTFGNSSFHRDRYATLLNY